MLLFTTLYSGSSGNSTLIRSSSGALLIDMGCSCRRTLKELYSLKIAAHDLCGILITHEHSDHIGGLKTFLKNYRVPVYGSRKTLEAIDEKGIFSPDTDVFSVEPGTCFDISGMSVYPFRTSHDSADCVGYKITADGASLAVATDIGRITDEAWNALEGCELVGLESNYDDNMLLTGPYTYQLKSRIRSAKGHLSNDDCAGAAVRLAQSGTRHMVLMHLSKENNLPELALTCCLSALEDNGLSDRMNVRVAPRDLAGETIEIRQICKTSR